uniref:Sushi domain-containing protein n=1 Tax=Branchiostoma floridae TaxID=7739 RepID=C3ZIV2_BRAFL|eukprot:XP_002591542.1 hypothetical protein BRAFLDRAFT_92771 [Branchiostoma floridae]
MVNVGRGCKSNTHTSGCTSPYLHGEECSYRCSTGYTHVSGNREKTCSNGQWAGIDMVCEEVVQVPDDEMGALVNKYAPKVWLEKGEQFNPSSVDFHLQNVKVYDGGDVYTSTPSTLPTCSENCYLSSKERLSKPSSTLPFFGGESVGPTHQPPVYAVWKRINSVTTDIFYWMFYPYNRGKKVCIGQYDWDATSQTYRDGNDVVQMEGTHPILYSAKGSHGLWSTKGTHTYKKILVNEKLQDETSAGTAWDTWKNVLYIKYRPDGGYTGSWTWLNFKGRWGNKKDGCAAESVAGECVRNSGPKSLNYRSQMTNDDLD